MEPLMSQRFVRAGEYSRPKSYDMLGDLILPARHPRPAQSWIVPRQPFRLLDLPIEIQRLIYEHYFGHWDVTLEYERLTMLRSRFHVQGVPPLDLVLSCGAVASEAKEIRMRCFTGRLILNSVFILVPLRRQDRFEWLRQNVRTLHFSDSSVHPERWNRYYDSFPNLQMLEIDFPRVISLDCTVLEEILGGGQDEVLVSSLDSFRLALVDQLSGDIGVVVSQRYCLRESLNEWKGIINVEIRLSENGAKVIKRTHRIDDNKAGGTEQRRPAEL